MALVQIEESELAALRQERNEAKSKVETLQTESRDLTTKVEAAETAQKAAEKTAADEKTRADGLEDKAQKSELKDKRMSALGAGFIAKLGDTSKTRLGELASTCSDEQWDMELKEREEMAKVKRDAAGDTPPAPDPSKGGSEAAGFKDEEVASFLSGSVTRTAGDAPPPDGSTSVKKLARAFAPKKTAAATK